MKKLLLFVFSLVSLFGYSQNRYYQRQVRSTYQAPSFDEMAAGVMARQKRYEANQQYLYDLKKWILELKPQIVEQQFLKRLDKEYKDLTDIEDGDLSLATTYLKQTENAIREIISDYNSWVNQQNSQNQKTPSSNENTNSAPDYASKGYEFQKKGEFADAIYFYTQYLKNDQNNTDVLFLRAMCKSELGDRIGAINDYDKIIEMEGDVKPKVYKMSTVYNNKAYCLVGLNKYKEALPLVNKALDMDKSEAYIWDTRGEIYFHIGEYEKSIKDMDRAISIEENANSFYYRGLSNLKLNRKTKACSDFSKAGELGESKAYVEITKNCK